MNLIKPSKICGLVYAPASKSHMVRALAAAMLCKKPCLLKNPSYCTDGLAAIGVIENLGAKVHRTKDGLLVTGGVVPVGTSLNCIESGLSIRLFSAIAALYNHEIFLNAEGSLRKRPLEMIKKPLEQLGAKVLTDNGFAPVSVHGSIKGGYVEVDASESSQFLSGLLMALPLCNQASTLVVKGLKSKPYVLVTLEMLSEFKIDISYDESLTYFEIKGGQQYRKSEYQIVGDWSGVAFLAVAAAIAGRLQIMGTDSSNTQADRTIIKALKLAGASVEENEGSLTVQKRELKAFLFDATACPDLFPSLVALAINCEGVSKITGVNRLYHKESNRAAVLVEEFSKLGATLYEQGDQLIINGGKLKGGLANSHGDHRIAMALAVAALKSEVGVEIKNAQVVDKSYPHFFSDLQKITEKST